MAEILRARRLSYCAIVAFTCSLVGTSALAEGYDENHPFTLAPSETGLTVSAFALYDDNVTRTDGDILSDESIGLSIGDGSAIPLNPYLRVLVDGEASVERFDHWTGLSHMDLGARAQLQFRPSAAFYAPTLASSIRVTGLDYETRLRTGDRWVGEVSVFESLTDQVSAFVALSHEERRAENATFAGHSDGARIHLEDALSSTLAIYVAFEHRYGDTVTTSFPDPDNQTLALASTPDAAFGDTGRITYRIKAATNFATLGVNHAIGDTQSIDFSWRKAAAKPAGTLTYAGATQAKYTDNQFVLNYLVRF